MVYVLVFLKHCIPRNYVCIGPRCFYIINEKMLTKNMIK